MTCKLCPARRHCWDKGNCEECEFGKAFEGLNKKIQRLKAKNEVMQSENKELKNKIEILTNPNF